MALIIKATILLNKGIMKSIEGEFQYKEER